jgi:outer membrane cobalamin receptor
VTLSSFALVGLSGFCKLTRDVQLTTRVKNLLDQDYEEVYPYRASGVGFLGGLRAQF